MAHFTLSFAFYLGEYLHHQSGQYCREDGMSWETVGAEITEGKTGCVETSFFAFYNKRLVTFGFLFSVFSFTNDCGSLA